VATLPTRPAAVDRVPAFDPPSFGPDRAGGRTDRSPSAPMPPARSTRAGPTAG